MIDVQAMAQLDADRVDHERRPDVAVKDAARHRRQRAAVSVNQR
jgi:hypothetical protein